jgi:hypothetical protein
VIDHLVAVGPYDKIPAIRGPEQIHAFDPNQHQRYDADKKRFVDDVYAQFEVLPLTTALNNVYPVDAHLVAYIVHKDGVPLDHQPRITKAALPYVEKELGYQLFASVVFLDIDNEPHEPWTPEMRRKAFEQYAEWDKADIVTWGIYHTKNGARFVQPLSKKIPIADFEDYMAEFREQIEKLGVKVDERCKDWTRVYRLPNVFRGGQKYHSPYVRL